MIIGSTFQVRYGNHAEGVYRLSQKGKKNKDYEMNKIPYHF